MKLVAAVKLKPSREQAAALSATLARCNEACTWLAAIGFENGTFRQFDLHKLAYTALRGRFGLTAQAAVRCVAKTADAFKINRTKPPIFRRDAAQPYDDRIIRFTKDNAVSIWTVEGRLTIPVAMGDRQRALMTYRKGEVDLCKVRGQWVLAATCDIPETDEFRADDWLGVDLGIVALAADSDGVVHSGGDVERIRIKFSRRRAGLQRRGTKAAKRRLRKLSGRQSRFQKITNHRIAKALVQTAERTGRGIALEDLKHIRRRVTARHGQRARLHNWAFGHLRACVAYKAKLAGVPVAYVDPRHTSIGCRVCGVIDKKSRPDQATFSCVACGHTEPADVHAARNIRARATVTTPYVLAAA